MTGFHRVFRFLLIIISFLTAISCSGNSSGSTTTGFLVDVDSLSAPSPAPTSNAVINAYTQNFGSGTVRYAVVTQTETQTGVALSTYAASGRELAKVICFANEGSSTKPLPATGSSVTYSDPTTGVIIVKYASDATNSAGTALTAKKTIGNFSFTLTNTGSNRYTVSSLSLPDSNVTISGTFDNVVNIQ